jgi:hypothetical protein
VNKRRISDSIATRTRARLVAQQTFASASAPTEELVTETPEEKSGERKPVITASALTMYLSIELANDSLTLARSSSNPFSPPVDQEKFTGLPLASPFHEKKSFFENSTATGRDENIKNYFGVSKGSKKDKNSKGGDRKVKAVDGDPKDTSLNAS